LLEEITDTAGADADKHLDEVRTGNREERDVRFASDSASEQGLTGSWRSNQQYALRNAAAEFLKFLRIFQEFDDFLKLFFGFISTGHVLESGFLLLRRKQTSARLAKA